MPFEPFFQACAAESVEAVEKGEGLVEDFGADLFGGSALEGDAYLLIPGGRWRTYCAGQLFFRNAVTTVCCHSDIVRLGKMRLAQKYRLCATAAADATLSLSLSRGSARKPCNYMLYCYFFYIYKSPINHDCEYHGFSATRKYRTQSTMCLFYSQDIATLGR